jgi:hypothetical protein
MVRSARAAALLALLSACGGGGDSGNPSVNVALPADAVAMESAARLGMRSAVARMTAYEAALLFVLDPGSTLTPGIIVADDVSPGAMPFSVTFAGNLDSGFDALAQTHIAGRSTFAADPATSFTSVSGQAAVDVTLLGGMMSVYHADLDFTVGASERTVSGVGVLQNPINGNKSTMTVDPAKPLRMVLATGPTANACGYVIDGDFRLVVVGPLGTYASTWRFVPGSPTTTVDTATHTDTAGVVTAMPAIDVDLRCNPAAATIDDWAGVYRQIWGCLPRELGSARLALTVKDATTVTINDEDPPGSGNGNIYEAAIVGSSARALRGFFVTGPVGFRYREDFNWTLSADGTRFTQASRYVYQDGPLAGTGGNCFARAVRE